MAVKHYFVGKRVAVVHPDDDTEVLYYGTMVDYKAPICIIRGKPGDIRQEHETAVYLADADDVYDGMNATEAVNQRL